MRHFLLAICCLSIFITFNSNAQWSPLVTSPVTAKKCAFFKSINEGFLGGTGKILRTLNGVSWDTVSYASQGASLNGCIIESIHFISVSEGIACGMNAVGRDIIFKTFDGGITWNSIVYQGPLGTGLNCMSFLDALNGFCSGKDGRILKTTNGGNTWSVMASPTINELFGMQFIGGNGWIAGDESILMTVDSGLSWSQQVFPGEFFRDIHFTDIMVGYAVGNHIYKTTNGGLTWIQVQTSSSISIAANDITSTHTDTLFIASNGSLLKSNDGGATWFYQQTVQAGKNYEFVYFYSSLFGITGSSSGEVYRTNSNGDPVQQHDGGLTAIVSQPLTDCPGNYPVVATLKNFGQSSITQARIDWTVNGIAQQPYIYTGNLPYDSSVNVLIGNADFTNLSNGIVAFTSQINNVADYIHTNDTAYGIYVFRILTGNYSAGGTGAHFPTIDSAFNHINSFGICGNVTLSINNGYYYATKGLNDFPRSSASDSLVITSVNGDSGQVTIDYLSNWFLIDKAKKITLSSIGLKGNGNSVVYMNDSVKNINVLNCLIYNSSSTGYGISHGGQAYSNLRIERTHFKKGDHSLQLNSTNKEINDGLFIYQCIFDSSKTAVNIYYGKNIQISNNQFWGGINYFTGVTLLECNNGFNIHSNRMHADKSDNLMLFVDCHNSVGNEGSVSNNFLSMAGTSGTRTMFKLIDSDHINFYYNSLYSSNGSVCMLIDEPDTLTQPLVNFKNNIVTSNSTSFLFNLKVPVSTPFNYYSTMFNAIGYNAYFISTPAPGNEPLFSNAWTFEEWLGFFPADSTSVFANAEFADEYDYKIYPRSSNIALNGAAIPISGYTTDIDGKIRSVSTPDIGCYEFNLNSNDASVSLIDSSSTSCSGITAIKVSLLNAGSNSFNTVSINWAVNGNPQAPFIYNNPIAPGATATVTIGSYNFLASTAYEIKCWSSLPGGINDLNKINDTCVINFTTLSAGMSGNFTIGGTAPDFSSFSDAISALLTNGMCSSVVFNVRPGIYNENLVIPGNIGISDLKTLEFKAENGDSSSVLLWSKTDNVIRLFATGYVTLSHLTIADSSTSNRCIISANTSHHISILNCHFFKPFGNTIDFSYPASFIEIKNCRFDSSTIACNLALSASNFTDINIENCFFNGQLHAGILISDVKRTVLRNNVFIKSGGFSSGSGAILLNNSEGHIEITGNHIRNANTQNGIGISNYAPPFNKSIIANNMVSVYSSSSDVYGIRINSGNNMQIAYNSVCLDSLTADCAALYIYATNTQIMNNSFSAAGINGYALEVRATNSNIYNYNNYFTLKKLGIKQLFSPDMDVNTWNELNGHDGYSYSSDPGHYSATNLHVSTGFSLLNNGKPIAGLSFDIDGDPRNPMTPDIGADEFSIALAPDDAGIVDVVYDGIVCSGNQPIKVVLKNFGTNPLSNVTINWDVNGILQSPFLYNGMLSTLSSDTVIIGTYNLLQPYSYTISAWTNNPNNSTDGFNVNDTSFLYDQRQKLTGSYTIGGVNPDYMTIEGACSDLATYGICGPVVFNIRPGSYLGPMSSITAINGTSAINTVTFRAEDGDSTSVSINTWGFGQAATLALNDVSYLNFSHVTINGATASNYSVFVSLGSSHCRFTNCIINSKSVNISSGCNYNVLANNTINNSVILNGDQDAILTYGNEIRNNNINFYNAIYCYGQDDLVIENNRLINTYGANPGGPGIALYGGSSKYTVLKNSIRGNYSMGIIVGQWSSANDPSVVANNVVVLGNNATYGLYLSVYPQNVKVYYNTILIPATSNGIPFTNSAQLFDGSEVKNNQFITYNNNPSFKWLSPDSTGNFIMDYNNFYTNGPSLIEFYTTQYSSLTQYQSAHPGYELNSTSIDPMISDTAGLYPHNHIAYGTGIPVAEVTDDISGNIRSLTNTTMGAYESIWDSLTWPGDANYDGIANNYDILSLGLYFNDTGLQRASVSNSWTGFPSSAWGSYQYNMMDKKHADCNGDGIINWSDTVAIKQNWGFTHPLRPFQPDAMKVNPELYFVFDDTAYNAGDTVHAELWTGNSLNTLSALYGIAFDINLPQIVDLNSAVMDFNSSWLGIENSTLITAKRTLSNIAGAACRISGSDTSGFGKLGTLQFIIDPIVSTTSQLILSVNNYLALTAGGGEVSFNVIADSVTVLSSVSIDEKYASDNFNVYPNPADDILYINYSLITNSPVTIELSNAIGEIVVSKEVMQNNMMGKYTLNLPDNLNQGIYILKMLTDYSVWSEKIVIR